MMKLSLILSKCDHTLLAPQATSSELHRICDEAAEFHCASVCIPSGYVKDCFQYLAGRIPVCTVVGFPNGYETPAAKCFMAEEAIADGASEIDTVIPIGHVKERRWDAVLSELRALRSVCGDKILKVIIETCLLTEEEKIRMCGIVTESGADFIKTSTGFGKAGADPEDIVLFRQHIGPNVRIKAAGGISSLSDAKNFIELGADRLGTSRLIRLCQEEAAKQGCRSVFDAEI